MRNFYRKIKWLLSTIGAPDRIRTCDLWLRRPTLYPAELRARGREGYAPAPRASMTSEAEQQFSIWLPGVAARAGASGFRALHAGDCRRLPLHEVRPGAKRRIAGGGAERRDLGNPSSFDSGSRRDGRGHAPRVRETVLRTPPDFEIPGLSRLPAGAGHNIAGRRTAPACGGG